MDHWQIFRMCISDLIGVAGDCDDHAEGRASRKWGTLLPFFSAPFAMLEAVGNHMIRETIPWVKMESNVRIAPGTTL